MGKNIIGPTFTPKKCFNPFPCTAFYGVERVEGSVGPPTSHSVPGGVRASRKKPSVLCSTKGSRWYPIKSQVNR